jgi:predicted nucleic acid-binding protein
MKNEETKHTPAPWSFRQGSSPHNQGQVYCEDNGKTLAVTYDDEDGANARLIAASPAMLAALQAALACLENLREVQQWDKAEGDHIDEAIDARDAVHLAIAKATA